MASPCIITYKDKEYSYPEFLTMLHDGGLDQLVQDGIIDKTLLSNPPISETEKANLEKIGEEVGKNFREIQNVYTKYGDKKPLSEITTKDYEAAQKKREESKTPPPAENVEKENEENPGNKTGRTKSYEQGRVPVNKEYGDIVNDRKVYYKQLNISDNAKSAAEYLESFGTDEQGIQAAYIDLSREFDSNPFTNPINGVAAELLADKLFYEANNAYLNGDITKYENLSKQSDDIREKAFNAARIAGQYNAALAILSSAANPDAFLLFVNRKMQDYLENNKKVKSKKDRIERGVKETEKEINRVKKEAIDETVGSIKEPLRKSAPKAPKTDRFTKIKDRGVQRQKDALAKLKKIGYLGSNGLNNEAIEAVGELILSQIEIGIYKASTIAKKIAAMTNGRVTDQHFKEVYDRFVFDVDGKEYTLQEYADYLKKEKQEANFDLDKELAKERAKIAELKAKEEQAQKDSIEKERLKTIQNKLKEAQTREKEISSRIDQALKAEDGKPLTMADLARKSLDVGADAESLANDIASEFGLSQQESQRISDRIYQEYKRKLTEKIDKVLSRELGVKAIKKIDTKENSGEIKPQDKTIGSKIINQVIAGALDSETLRGAFSIKYGLPVITPAMANNIKMLAMRSKEATTETSRMRANKALMQYVHQMIPVSPLNALSSAYYVSLLSGPSTALVNTIGNVNALINQRFENGIVSIIEAAQGNPANLVNPAGAKKIKYAISNINQGLTGALDILRNGGGESKYYNLDAKGLNNFDAERLVAKKDDFKDLNWAKLAKTIAKVWYTVPTLINRNLDASDAAFIAMNFNMEAIREVRKDLYKQGLRGKDLENATLQSVYGTKEIQQQAIADAQIEAAKIGLDPAKNKKFVKRIAFELIQNRLGEEIQSIANAQAKDNVYKGAHRGFSGYLAKKIPQMAFITPFVNTVMKVAERNMNYIPLYGIARYAGLSATDLARKSSSIDKVFTQKGIERAKREGEMRNKQLAQVILSHALLGTLYGLTRIPFDDDDDPNTPDVPFVQISGGYIGMSYNDRQKAIKIMPEYTIRIGNKSMNYEQNPLIAMAALPLSVAMDYERVGKDKSDIEFLRAYSKALPLFLMNQTPLQNISDLFKKLRDATDPSRELEGEEQLKEAGTGILNNFVIKPAANIAEPNAYQQMADVINPKKYNATDFEEVLWKAFNMEKIGGLHQTYDMWGRPVEFYPGERRLPFHYWLKNAGDDEVDVWGAKNDISIPIINLNQLILDLNTGKSSTLKSWEKKQEALSEFEDEMSELGQEIQSEVNYRTLTHDEWQDMDQTVRQGVYEIIKTNFKQIKSIPDYMQSEINIEKPFSQMKKREADDVIKYLFDKKRQEYIQSHWPIEK